MVWFRETNLQPERADPLLEAAGSHPLREPTRAAELLRRPGVGGMRLQAQGRIPFDGEADFGLEAEALDIRRER